ncbi:hypothetical protein ACFLQN_02900 [Candidatus Aenigmatarchaeota archaeon]
MSDGKRVAVVRTRGKNMGVYVENGIHVIPVGTYRGHSILRAYIEDGRRSVPVIPTSILKPGDVSWLQGKADFIYFEHGVPTGSIVGQRVNEYLGRDAEQASRERRLSWRTQPYWDGTHDHTQSMVAARTIE